MEMQHNWSRRLMALTSLLLICAMLFTSCNMGGGQPIETSAPTETSKSTEDSKSTDNKTDPHVHEWSEWAVTLEPTCTAAGEQSRSCACGESETQAIDAKRHNYVSVVTDPTCTESGYTTHSCDCGDTYQDTYVDATGHSFGEWTTTKEATCSANGEQKRECTCGEVETKVVPATGHNYSTTVTKPTCEERGYTTYTCDCGDSYVDNYVSATDHSFGGWKTTKAPTCTEKGEQQRECICGEIETRSISATGHSYAAKVTKPTCTERGYTTFTCDCGESYVDEYVAAKGHTYTEWKTITPKTCTTDGKDERYCECGKTETRVIKAIGHVYSEWKIAEPAHCTVAGREERSCECGEIESRDIAALGHSFSEWIITKEPTRTEDGEKKRVCSRCLKTETDVVPTTGQLELDFEGEELTIMLRDHEVTVREWYKESPEDELDEAIAMRNAAVEQTLNVEINYDIMTFGGWSEYLDGFNTVIVDDIVQDLHYYDIAVHWALAAGYASIRDCNANLLDEETFPYFDFSLPCWNQSIVNTEVNGRLHLIAGDINISQFDYASVIWYNKTLYDLKKEPTDHENIQDLALEGLWTYDELYMWATRLHEDSNGTEGWQADDTYGYAEGSANVLTQPVPKDSMAAAFDIDLLLTNPDGTHSYNIVGNEKAAKAREMWIKLHEATGTWSQGGSVNNFASGRYLFWANSMYPSKDANMTIREMEDKYGLLPLPKYDKNQEQYYTAAYDGYSLMSVLDHANSSIPTKGEAISAYLQLATEESYTSVRGYYFNRIVKPKYFGTDDSDGTVTKSIALFNIIVDNIRADFWNIYSAQLNNLTWKWRSSLVATSDSLEAAYLAAQWRFDYNLSDMDAWFGLITLD